MGEESRTDFQQLWEACVTLSEKAEFRVVLRHLERMEARVAELEKLLSMPRDLAEQLTNAECGRIEAETERDALKAELTDAHTLLDDLDAAVTGPDGHTLSMAERIGILENALSGAIVVVSQRERDLQRNDAVNRVAELERMLCDLTPGGSEFVGSPERCARWVKSSLSESLRGRIAAVQDRKQAEAERDALQTEASRWKHSYEHDAELRSLDRARLAAAVQRIAELEGALDVCRAGANSARNVARLYPAMAHCHLATVLRVADAALSGTTPDPTADLEREVAEAGVAYYELRGTLQALFKAITNLIAARKE